MVVFLSIEKKEEEKYSKIHGKRNDLVFFRISILWLQNCVLEWRLFCAPQVCFIIAKNDYKTDSSIYASACKFFLENDFFSIFRRKIQTPFQEMISQIFRRKPIIANYGRRKPIHFPLCATCVVLVASWTSFQFFQLFFLFFPFCFFI